jgi:exodeoxyribonuclease-5
MSVQFDEDQQEALRRLERWHKSKYPVFVFDGPAGCGKTELIRVLPELLNCRVGYATYTAKAASVLQDKGIECNTLHSVLCRPSREDSRHDELEARIEEEQDPRRREKLVLELNSLLSQVEFQELDETALKVDVLVVDEYSMVNEWMFNAITRAFKQVLFVGDSFQLPPVKAETEEFPLPPDLRLTKVHRYAGPLYHVANRLRTDRAVPRGERVDGFTWRRLNDDAREALLAADITLCWSNENRRKLNGTFRRRRGFEGPLPHAGEPVVCLRNKRLSENRGVWNGQIGLLQEECELLDEATFRVTWPHRAGPVGLEADVRRFTPDVFRPQRRVDAVRAARLRLDPDKYAQYKERNPPLDLDYGYALTVHKSQGSEWGKVCLYHDYRLRQDETYLRWLYTAITRAKTSVDVIDMT